MIRRIERGHNNNSHTSAYEISSSGDLYHGAVASFPRRQMYNKSLRDVTSRGKKFNDDKTSNVVKISEADSIQFGKQPPHCSVKYFKGLTDKVKTKGSILWRALW